MISINCFLELKIILNKNLDLDAAIELGKGNNIVMTANDSTTNNTNPLYKAVVENRASIIFRADLSKTTGLLSVNGGNLINSGNILIESQESNGIVVLENSTGSNIRQYGNEYVVRGIARTYDCPLENPIAKGPRLA